MEFIQNFFEEMIYKERYNIVLHDTISNFLLEERLRGGLTFRQWFNYQARLLNWRDHYRFEKEILIKAIYRILYDSEANVKKTIKDVFRSFNKCVINDKEFEALKKCIDAMIYARKRG